MKRYVGCAFLLIAVLMIALWAVGQICPANHTERAMAFHCASLAALWFSVDRW